MKRIIAGLTGVLAAAGLALSCGAATSAAPAARPATHVSVVLETCPGTGNICRVNRGRYILLTYGPAAWLQHMHWSYWGPNSADGSGWFWEGAAVAWRVGHTSVRFYRPEWSKQFGWHFTRMYMPAVGTGRNHQGATIWRWVHKDGVGIWEEYSA